VGNGLATLVLLAGGAHAAKAQLSVAVGTTSATQTTTVTVTTAGETASTTANAIFVLTQGTTGLDFNFVSGGSCALSHTYAAEAACTVKYSLNPKYSGVRYGAVQLKSSTGVVLGTAFLSGIGIGPQPIFPQTTINTLPGTYNQPRNMAIDGAGDIYVSNFGAGTVAEIPAGCTTSSCVTTVGGGFSGPSFVAVDGAGSIYVADFSASVVDEMPAGCASASCVTPLGGGFNQPISVRVDGSGNVFVADFGNSAVKKIPQACTTSTCVLQLGTGFQNPQDVALDGSGNIYVADYGNSLVKSMAASCSNTSCMVTTLGGGFNIPSGVAVDGNGNVYVGDAGNNAVKVMAPGCTPANATTCVTTLPNTFSSPIGVALDGGGDLYVADNGNNAIREIPLATPPSVAFPNVYDGSTGTAQAVTLTNYGNQSLAIAVPSTGVNPSASSSFTLATTGTGACPSVSAGGSAATLAANASCTLSINFAPVSPASGTVTGSVILTDNGANVAGSTQTIALSGTATKLVPVITSISPTEGLPTGGITVTINGSLLSAVTAVNFGSTSATSFQLVSDTQMTAVSPAEAVAVVDVQATNAQGQSVKTAGDQFTYTNSLPNAINFPALVNATLGGTPPIPAATATSGQPVTYTTATPTICTIAGISITQLKAGTCTITASQNAVTHYAAATPVSQSFQVFLAENIGTQSTTQTATLTFTTAVATGTAFTTNLTTLGVANQDFNLATGGTCVSGRAFAAGATCTVNYTFKPLYAGIRSGGVTLTTGSGTSASIVASAYIAGQGMGPQIITSASPTQIYGTQNPIAVDGNGTVYVLTFDGNGNNFIVIIPQGCTDASCQTQINPLPSPAPSSIAVDGIGNIYLTDKNGYLVVLPPGCRSSCALTRAVLAEEEAVAVDMVGNIYIAGGNGLTEIPPNCFSASCMQDLGGGVGNLGLQTMSIDLAGNVYFVGSGSNSVNEMSPNCLSASCVTVLGGGAFQATGVAVDPNGNVYFNGLSIYMMPPNCLSSSCVQTIYAQGSPYGMILDAQGNMYAPSNGSYTFQPGIFAFIRGTGASIVFGVTADGTSSSPSATSVTNYGNQPLVFSGPATGTSPSVTGEFSLLVDDAGECPMLTGSTATASLAPNGSCNLPVVFMPVNPDVGTINGTLTLTDNSLNVASGTQTILLTGTAFVAPTVTGVTPTSGPTAGGTFVTITGTKFLSGSTVTFGNLAATNVTVVSATTITATSPRRFAGGVDVQVANSAGTSAANGSDQFTYIGLPNTITFPAPPNTPLGAPAPLLNATATSGTPVTYASSNNAVCTVTSGVVTDKEAGTCTITASQLQTGQYAAATPVSHSYQVTLIPFVFVGGSGSVESFNSYGTKISTAKAGGGIGAAVDAAGYVWSIDSSGSGVSRFSPSAGALASDYTGIGLNSATALAIDGSGQVWIANASGTVSILTNAGAPAATINDPSFSGTTSIAIDISGTVWVTNATNNTVDEIVGGAAPSAPLANAVQNNTPGTRP